MNKQSKNLRPMTQLALLLALLVVLTFTPLGFIPIPPVSITIMHVPVIIGGILLGSRAGGLLGGAFGVLSMMRAVIAPAGPVDVMFNPAASGNPIGSIIMAVLPRILLGLVAAWLWKLLKGRVSPTLAVAIAAIFACLVHSFGVLGLLSGIFSAFPLQDVFAAIIGINGLLELGVGVVLSICICRAVMIASKRRS